MQVASPKLDNQHEIEQTARRAGEVLNEGGVIVLPTETVYGVAAAVAHPGALQRLRELKQRSSEQPFTVHLPSRDASERYIGAVGPAWQRLVRKVMPGPVTLVVDVDQPVIEKCVEDLALGDHVRDELYHEGKIGLRCPDHPLSQAILSIVDGPVVASSANRRGAPPPHHADAVAGAISQHVDLVVDGGPTRYAKPSTILRVQPGDDRLEVSIEREGVYDERFVRKLLRWSMLLVCSGNTCRSPMAELIAKQIVAESKGLSIDQLEAAGLRIRSAGTFAAPGTPASPEAVQAMAKMGLDLSGHHSQPLTVEMIHEADVIYCMTQSHCAAVVNMVPSAADKTFPLDPNGDVSDPIGGSLTVYQRCAELFRRRLAQRIREQQP